MYEVGTKTKHVDNRCFTNFPLLSPDSTTLAHQTWHMSLTYVRNPDEIPNVHFFQTNFSVLEWLCNGIALIVVILVLVEDFTNSRTWEIPFFFFFFFLLFLEWRRGSNPRLACWKKISCPADDANEVATHTKNLDRADSSGFCFYRSKPRCQMSPTHLLAVLSSSFQHAAVSALYKGLWTP